MNILRPAAAGTQESSDAQVLIEPLEEGVSLVVYSSVMRQYGRRIRRVALEALERLAVSGASVTIHDKGALDCTIKARVEAAVYRASGRESPVDWNKGVRP